MRIPSAPNTKREGRAFGSKSRAPRAIGERPVFARSRRRGVAFAGLQTAAVARPSPGHGPLNPRPKAAPPLIDGFFITTKPDRSRCSTSPLATISAMISPALWTRFRP